ncbi:MAG: GntR family transcriptional regulator [Roseitalea porphyridii]|jgi:DNA-binding GntR family transcriptional regulator|uniref:GntR family transcriptional regulator n=1 Tax=Roseitalea porphyridii TaxID=1852022 RepID=UPI0032EF2822
MVSNIIPFSESVDAGNPADAPRQSDVAYGDVLQAIIVCDIAPGTLVSEASLSERFGCRKAAMRAALERLAAIGMVEPVARRGYRVKAITLRDVNNLFQVREIIELPVVRAAAATVDAGALRMLDAVRAADYVPGDRRSEARFLHENTRFHLLIAESAGNERLTAMLAQLYGEMERLFHFGLALRDRSQEMTREHTALIEALAAGDADTAVKVMAEEHASSKAMVLDAIMRSDTLLDVSLSAARRGEDGDSG